VEEAVAEPLPIIDEVELDTVRTYLTGECFAAFLNQCADQISKYVEDLERRPAPSHWLTTLAHSMIGSAGAIGAGKVVAIARRLEAASAANDVSVVNERTAQLIAAWSEAAHELKRRRDLKTNN